MTWIEQVEAHRQAVKSSFAIFGRTPHETMLWATTVIVAYVVTLDDDIADTTREAVDAYHIERAAVYQRSGRTYRGPRGWTRWAGAVEIDLIHPKLARRFSRTKAGLLTELGVDVAALRADQRVVIVHEHAVIDHRGHASADALIRDMRAAWPGARRVHAARLHTEGTIAQNVDRLADYVVKFKLRYGVAWNGKKTSYLSDYEPEWREFMRRLYLGIGIPRLLSANVTSQAVSVANRGGTHTTRLNSTAETVESGPEQLRPPDDVRSSEHDDEFYFNDNDKDTKENNENIMKIREIIDEHIDFDTIEDDVQGDVEAALARLPRGLTDEEKQIMYGDEGAELELARQRLELVRLQAEVEEILAAAAKDRAEADRRRPR